MKKLLLISVFSLSIALNAQQIYTNGPLSTTDLSNSGVLAPTGYTWSEVQNNTGNTTESNINGGFSGIFNNALTTNNKLADDFIVPAGVTWNVSSLEFYLYQTGFTGTVPPIDQLRVQIFSSDPSIAGAVSVAGDMTTNVLNVANSSDALMYRIFNSTTPTPNATGTTRKIWKVRGNLTVSLPAGTYWILYQVHATNDLAAFFPSVTIPGTRGNVSWNAKQQTTTGWTSLIDGGNPASAPDFSQDVPFNVNGVVSPLATKDFIGSKFLVTPNPANDFINISNSENIKVSNIKITDLNGRVVKQNNFDNVSNINLNVSDLSSGVYMMNINTNEGSTVKKIIKN